MRLEKLELAGFRRFEKDSVSLTDLTVLSGEMGSGKTSKLLAVLFALTGSTVSGLHLDDLINIDSEFMWVRVEGKVKGHPFYIERRKRRGQATVTRTDLPSIPKLSERIFIEGREIAKLFIGAPTEKAFKLDALLGLQGYDQIISELSTAPLERRIDTLNELKASAQQHKALLERAEELEKELERISRRLQEIEERLASNSSLYSWAEELMRREEEARRVSAELESKKSILEGYKAQLSSLPPFPQAIEEELKEMEARYDAMQKRIAFLEAAMQTLDLVGKKIEEIVYCPLCGGFISPKMLERFKGYSDEYKKYIEWSTDLESLLAEKRRAYEEARRNEEKRRLLEGEIRRLENEISQVSYTPIPAEERERAEGALSEKKGLLDEKKELELRRRGLEEQRAAYRATLARVQAIDISSIESKLEALSQLAERLRRIKRALSEAVNEARAEQLEGLRASFKDTFKRIYPYQRFSDVDFEAQTIRGREVLQVRAKVDDRWIYSHQMSTGENVALSFALLYAVNRLEASPILLLDEPEEGLDEGGIEGLADVLLRLKASTQLVVATRSRQFAQLLERKVQGL